MSCALATAAGQDASGRLFAEMLPWLLLLAAATTMGGVLIYMVKRSLKRDDSHSEGFTLQDLRDLHAAGRISTEEFERARAQMIGRIKAAAQPPADDQTAPPGNSTSPEP